MPPPDATLGDVIAFVRNCTGLGPRRAVTSKTRLDTDPSVTGDDGVGLIRSAERRFAVVLTSEVHGIREAFGLGTDEVLFAAEGFDPFGWMIGSHRPIVRDLTVAEPRQAIAAAAPATAPSPSRQRGTGRTG